MGFIGLGLAVIRNRHFSGSIPVVVGRVRLHNLSKTIIIIIIKSMILYYFSWRFALLYMRFDKVFFSNTSVHVGVIH